MKSLKLEWVLELFWIKSVKSSNVLNNREILFKQSILLILGLIGVVGLVEIRLLSKSVLILRLFINEDNWIFKSSILSLLLISKEDR